MFESCLKKQQQMKELFLACSTDEAKYEKLIELGRQYSASFNETYKTKENLVQGCQSQVYLHSSSSGENILFEATSDALISAGLAALLTQVYSGETSETVLKCPPTYLDELGIRTSLTPTRANGLYSIHLRMKQEALNLLIKKSPQS